MQVYKCFDFLAIYINNPIFIHDFPSPNDHTKVYTKGFKILLYIRLKYRHKLTTSYVLENYKGFYRNDVEQQIQLSLGFLYLQEVLDIKQKKSNTYLQKTRACH